MRMWPPELWTICRNNFPKTPTADSEALLSDCLYIGTSDVDQKKGVSGASESICCNFGGRFVEDFVHGEKNLQV